MQSSVDTETTQPAGWASPFFTIWTGQAFSLFGSNLVQFALIWWLTKTTNSATMLAMASLAGLLPQIVLSPFAGALVDRWNRRLVMMAADSLIAFFSLGLVYLFAAGLVQPWHVFVIMFLRSAGGAFHWPAMQASTSLMVPKVHLARISGLNQTLMGVMNIAAPPFGAWLITLIPMHQILLIDVVTACMAVLPLFFVAVPQPKRVVAQAQEASKTSLWQDLGSGLHYVGTWPGMLIILIVATALNFFLTPAFSLVPLLVTKHFHGEAMQLGMINSAFGIGLVVGGLILSAWGGFRRRIATSMVGLIGMGLGILAIGFTPANLFGLAVAGMAVGGLMNPITNGPLFAVVQSTVAPEMQGRVLSLMNAGATAMSPLSLAIAGPVSDALGIQLWYVLSGIVCILMGAGAFFVRPVMNLEEQRG